MSEHGDGLPGQLEQHQARRRFLNAKVVGLPIVDWIFRQIPGRSVAVAWNMPQQEASLRVEHA